MISKYIQKAILNKIHAGSKLFAVIADECRDCANKDQMSLMVRFFDTHSTIQEAFLAFVECEYGTSGEQLAALIQNTCCTIGLDMRLCRGQRYNGAGNMAGQCNRAVKLVQSKFPKAFNFHCASHKLNLYIAHFCKLTSVANMMDEISSFAVFSKKICKYPDVMKSKLLPLCRTRWVERINALKVALDLLKIIVDTFSDMIENTEKIGTNTLLFKHLLY